MDFSAWSALDINMHSDASKSLKYGELGAICKNDWMYAPWNYSFVQTKNPSIEYLELFALAAGVITWIHRFSNKRIYLFCDNITVVHMVNNSSSKCKNCMVLIRIITLISLHHNVRVYAKFVPTKQNFLADSLSRLKINKLKQMHPQAAELPTPVPDIIWSMEKIWVD